MLYFNYNVDNKKYRSNVQFVYNKNKKFENAYFVKSNETFFEKKNYDKSTFYIESIVDNNDYNQIKHNVDNFNAKNNFVKFFFIEQSIIQQINRTCYYYNKCFYFNNKLHKHLRVYYNQSKLIKKQKQSSIEIDIYFANIKLFIIKFNALIVQ